MLKLLIIFAVSEIKYEIIFIIYLLRDMFIHSFVLQTGCEATSVKRKLNDTTTYKCKSEHNHDSPLSEEQKLSRTAHNEITKAEN